MQSRTARKCFSLNPNGAAAESIFLAGFAGQVEAGPIIRMGTFRVSRAKRAAGMLKRLGRYFSLAEVGIEAFKELAGTLRVDVPAAGNYIRDLAGQQRAHQALRAPKPISRVIAGTGGQYHQTHLAQALRSEVFRLQ